MVVADTIIITVLDSLHRYIHGLHSRKYHSITLFAGWPSLATCANKTADPLHDDREACGSDFMCESAGPTCLSLDKRSTSYYCHLLKDSNVCFQSIAVCGVLSQQRCPARTPRIQESTLRLYIYICIHIYIYIYT